MDLKAERLKIRAEEEKRAQEIKDKASIEKIRQEERDRAMNGGPLEQGVKSLFKKGVNEIRKSI